MKELVIPIYEPQDAPVAWPEGFEGLDLHLNDMEVFMYNECSKDYKLYPAEFTHEPGVFIFGVKQDYSPMVYQPEVRIRLDTRNRTFQVTNLSYAWESLVDVLMLDEYPMAIFKFVKL